MAFSVMASLGHALSHHCPWLIVALARSSLALLFSTMVAWGMGVHLVVWRPAALWVRSLAGSASLVCCFYALKHLLASDVLTLANTFPIWVAILSWPLEGEVPHWSVWVAAASGGLGAALIQQPHFDKANLAVGFALASAFLSSIAMLGLNRIQGVDPRAIVVHFSLVASLVCVVALVWHGEALPSWGSLQGWPLVMLLGLGLSATIGQYFLTRAFSAGRPTKIAVVGLSQIVFALLLDVVFLDHEFTRMKGLGIVLVAAPTAWLIVSRSRDGGENLIHPT